MPSENAIRFNRFIWQPEDIEYVEKPLSGSAAVSEIDSNDDESVDSPFVENIQVREDTPIDDSVPRETGGIYRRTDNMKADLGGAVEVPGDNDQDNDQYPSGDWRDDIEANQALMNYPDADYIYPNPLEETIPANAPDSDFAYPKEKKLYLGDETHLADAITALQPGGFEGKRVQIPKDEKKAVVARIRARVNKLSDQEKKKHLLGRLKDSGFVSETITVNHIFQFKGNFPKVATFSDVDVPSLTRGDDDPDKFVTLPIAQIGAVSENGLLYDESLVNSILNQIQANRPVGLQGHINQDEKSTAFPLPVGLWVGAVLKDGVLWAKAYLFKGPFRDFVKATKAVRGTLATSIYGDGDFEPVNQNVRRCLDLNLQSIDFAPAERASLVVGDGKQFELTSEYKDGKMNKKDISELETSQGQEEGLGPKDIETAISGWEDEHLLQHGKNVVAQMGSACRELHAQQVTDMMGAEEMGRHFGHVASKMGVKECAQALGEAKVKELHEFYAHNPEDNAKNVTTEAMGDEGHIAGELSEMKNTEISKTIQEMATELAQLRQKTLNADIDTAINSYVGVWNTSTERGKTLLNSLKTDFKNKIVAEMAVSKTPVVETAKKVWESGIKDQADAYKIAVSGPNAIVGNLLSNRLPDGKLATEEEAKAARANLGF